MNNILLSITGLTATGKTALALELAKLVIAKKLWEGVSIISADSRQVYQGLEILSGADIPPLFIEKEFGQQKHYVHNYLPIRVFGISIISPTESWSVANFVKYAQPIMSISQDQKFLTIVVGGTGLYHQQLVQPQPTLSVKPNQTFRARLESMPLSRLQELLKQLDPKKYSDLNNSDAHNPRRLIRAIEIAFSEKCTEPPLQLIRKSNLRLLDAGLFSSIPIIKESISKRVEARIKEGAITEVKTLLNSDLPKDSPIMSTIGVNPLSKYLCKSISLDEAKQIWINQEVKYAKRQLTWFKKRQPLFWLDSSHNPLEKQTSLIMKSLCKLSDSI